MVNLEKQRETKRRYNAWYNARPEIKARKTAWRRQYQKKWNRRAQLRLYRLTPERYDAFVVEQDNKCAICGMPGGETRNALLHIDHDHETGEVRGLLCNRCNTGLGCFSDSADQLEKAKRYLLDKRVSGVIGKDLW